MEGIKPLIVTIIVHYQSPKDCATLVNDLESMNYPNHKIVIVDNHSRNSDYEQLHRLLSGTDAILIRNIANDGYGSGINFGAKYADKFRPKFLQIINTDTRILNKNYFTDIVRLFSNDNSLGVIGPVVLKSDGSIQNTIMPYVSLKSVLYFKSMAKNQSIIESQPKLIPVNVINGVCLIINFDAFKMINGFDDAFFMYGEEQDFCCRLNSAGYKIGFWSGLGIQHLEYHNQKIAKVIGWRDILTRSNQVLYAKKHINFTISLIISSLFTVSFIIKALRGFKFIDINLSKAILFFFTPRAFNNSLKVK